MGFGTSRLLLLGCTGTSVHLEEILTTSPSLESPLAARVSTSRCRAIFSFSHPGGIAWNWCLSPLCTKTITPHNKGMIRRAISQSGVALCPWGINRNPRRLAEEVHNTVNIVYWTCGTFFFSNHSLVSSEIITWIMLADCTESQLPDWWQHGRVLEDDWPRAAYNGRFSRLRQLPWSYGHNTVSLE